MQQPKKLAHQSFEGCRDIETSQLNLCFFINNVRLNKLTMTVVFTTLVIQGTFNDAILLQTVANTMLLSGKYSVILLHCIKVK